jgi:ethanolamine ammonia-lyase large subunit
VPLSALVAAPVVDPDTDDVSRLILDAHDRVAFTRISSLTVGEFREFLLDDATTGETLGALKWAIVPEIAAAVAKLMGNKELVYAAAKMRNVTRCRNTMGARGVFGVRVQPNHPADDLAGILVSAIDGLSFGCGDAVIGVNPATDSVETVSSILRAGDRLKSSRPSMSRRRRAASRTSRRNSRPSTAAPRWTCCFSRSPARRRPTPASALISRC